MLHMYIINYTHTHFDKINNFLNQERYIVLPQYLHAVIIKEFWILFITLERVNSKYYSTYYNFKKEFRIFLKER